ncbi:protein decapping 5-like [Bidens hawaiensis]|uniref:protein decapping 5-like n=1 Tax=Bidens hawaiensis TaxID=980011 RepID=UPI00404A3053
MSAADVSKSSSSSSTADSYIGSLISLTSKSDIRYEGILYNINTEESSIGLRNVRSFGSEGRKKDGAQVLPSDKVYEYILFRGTDIKDLQVKTSTTAPPVQPAQPINNDPAIIQSNYPWPGPTPSNLQVGPTGPGFQGGMPLYQPDVNTSSLAMPPMYWPGYYAPPTGLPHQQSLYRPAPMQYPGFASSLPGGPPNLSNSLLGSTLPSGLPPVPALLTSSEPLPSFMRTKVSNSVGPTALPPVSLTTSIPDPSVTVPLVSNKSNGLSGAPSLVTPDQLLQAGAQAVHKDVEPAAPAPAQPQAPKPVPSYESSAPAPVPKPTPLSEPSAPVQAPKPAPSFDPYAPALAPKPAVSSEPSAPVVGSTETQPPILPLPTQTSDPPKTNGGQYHNRNSYRGRERGRGSGGPRSVIKFTEEFDFTAMNEKFNKDEVWGTLGKNNKLNSNGSDEYDFEDENDAKPVYSKDDFFDTLSCNNDTRSNNGRTRFSEQMKLDTETFGEFSRYRGGGRVGCGPNRGGRSRGVGYYGRGYGYVNRARGGRNPARDY